MKQFFKKTCTLLIISFLFSNLQSQILNHSWGKIVHTKDEAWFATDEAKRIADNVLLYQRNIGGWPKNIQMQDSLTEVEKQKLRELKAVPEGATTDNGATILEMTYLSKMYKQVPDERYKKAFLLALNYLLDAQYENGGWPQYYPLHKGYYTHITFNDNSMVNIMNVLSEIFNKTEYFSIVPDENTINRSKKAFNKGIECILKTQYIQNGVLTGWCAQHDERTLLPAKARSYELPSLSGQESAGIVLLLMSLDNPTPQVKNAIHSAVAWFEKTKITGLRQERYFTETGVHEKRLVPDPLAPPLWARFMELEDNTPFFCDRDGIKKATMFEIGRERRNGYGWYSEQPQKVLEKYPAWKAKWDNN
ncbi:MAG: pectate lyase [Bacteroidales bacterium]|nr:pectate lyase [Bacteroidales bacterium]